MNHPASLRLTSSNSPFFRGTTPRSPVRARSQELGLQLKQVIGTTTSSVNGFDCLPSRRWFAFTAGAAGVLATVDEALQITQRFFRARPTATSSSREATVYTSPNPGTNDTRHRALNNIRDFGNGHSPLGSSARDWSESPTGKSTTAKDRVKAATSIALSPNGKWLAVGETGYRPRVLIFSTASDASAETPVAALSEHTFGVHALAFSADSRFLASLGTVNDGFLNIWTIDERTGAAMLYASNKCTSLVRQIAWMGRTLVTVGLRFIKVWRPDEEATSESARNGDFGSSIMGPRHKTLAGRNVLLGSLLDASFSAAVPISSMKAFICAESGEVCLLDDSAKTQTLSTIMNAGFRITAATLDLEEKLHVAGAAGDAKSFSMAVLERPVGEPLSPTPLESSVNATNTTVVFTVALATIDDTLVTLDSKRSIKLCKYDARNDGELSARTHQLQAHDDLVVGVRPIEGNESQGAAFLTFSSNGTVLFWSPDGMSKGSLKVSVESSSEMYGLTNELKAIMPLRRGSLLAAGDKYGKLSILDTASGAVSACVRAHSAEITDITVCQSTISTLLASASRDRTVQLFAWQDDALSLLQTLDEHAGAVTGLLFAKEGQQLLSCSADRTVVVREAVTRTEGDQLSVAFVISRTITLKSSPTSMCLTPDDDTLLVSTMDRSIGKFNTRNGQAGFSFRCFDADGGEAAVMSKVLHVSQGGTPVVVGVSSSDKSIRLYTEFGTLLARDWGHSEGITDIAVVASKFGETREQASKPRLVTVAADSTIFIWDIASTEPQMPSALPNGLAEALTFSPAGPPLRKVLSYSELSRLHRAKSADDGEPASPTAAATPTNPRSPRVRKRASRMSMAQTPILEASSRSMFADSGRKSMRHRSPSPPSPRNTKLSHIRKPSMVAAPRTKSSDNITMLPKEAIPGRKSSNTGFGSLTASTESVCRNLRAYRKKLAATSDEVRPETLRELEKELNITARIVGAKSQGKSIDEAMMARLLDQASEKIVGLLDERIKERMESEVQKSSAGSPATQPAPYLAPPVELDVVAGAPKRPTISE